MKYFVYNYVYTIIDKVEIPTEVRCRDENGEHQTFNLLEKEDMLNSGDFFIVDNLELVSLTNAVFENGRLISNNLSEDRLLSLLELITFLNKKGYEYFHKDSINIRVKKRFEKYNNYLKSIDSNELLFINQGGARY